MTAVVQTDHSLWMTCIYSTVGGGRKWIPGLVVRQTGLEADMRGEKGILTQYTDAMEASWKHLLQLNPTK